jgi:hypothetical protein
VIYGRLATAFGWTWEYIDECVTLPMLLEITEYWAVVPPIAESITDIRRALGWTPPIPKGAGGGTGPAAALDEQGALIGELLASGIALPPGL